MTALDQQGRPAAPDPDTASPGADDEPPLSADPVGPASPGGRRVTVRRTRSGATSSTTGDTRTLRDGPDATAEPSPGLSGSDRSSATSRAPFRCPTCSARLGGRHSPRKGLARCTILLTATRGLFAYECSRCRSRWSEARTDAHDAKVAQERMDTP